MNLSLMVKLAHAKNLQKISGAHHDVLKGGKADDMQPRQFPRKALREGTKHETEHTKDRSIAEEIAMDHLAEDPHYYKKIKKIEKTATSFLDELEKISLSAGDAAGYARSVAGRFGRYVQHHAEDTGKNLGNAAAAWAKPRESLKKGWHATWNPDGKPLGLGWKAMMGYGLISGAKDVASKKDPTGRGHSRVRRALRFVGDQAGGMIGAPFGMSGSILSSMAGSKLGDMAGAATEKIRGFRPKPAGAAQLPSRPVTPQRPDLPPRPTGLQG